MRILMSSHSRWWQLESGGTELFTSELVMPLDGPHQFFALVRDDSHTATVMAFRDKAPGLCHVYPLPEEVALNNIGGFSEALYHVYFEMLSNLSIDLVHIQHTMNIGHELTHAAAALEIPVVWSIHDYFSVCPSYTLLNHLDEFCGIPDDPKVCNQCLQTKFGIGDGQLPAIEEWRTASLNALKSVALLHFPSETARMWLLKAFPEVADRPYRILPTLLTSRLPSTSLSQKNTSKTPGPRNFLVLGQAGNHKGLSLLTHVIPAITHSDHVVTFLGSTANDWPLTDETKTRCRFLGHYRSSELPNLLHKINPDLILLMSTWPETYMRTLSEAWAAGFLVAVLPIGAQQERVNRLGGGVVLQSTDPDALATELVDFVHSSSRDSLGAPSLQEEDKWTLIEQYTELYRDVSFNHHRSIHPLQEAIKDIAEVLHEDLQLVTSRLHREQVTDGISVAEDWQSLKPIDKESIEDFYKTSSSYLYDLEVASRLKARRMWRERIVAFLRQYQESHTRLLDYGCGNGADALYYGMHGLDVTVYDLESPHLNLARFRSNKLSLSINFFSDSVPIPENELFTAITCFEVLEHLVSPTDVVREISGKLMVGGFAFLTESFGMVGPHHPSHLENNVQYVGGLSDLAAAADLAFRTTLLNRIAVFQKIK